MDKALIDVHPVVVCLAVAYLQGYVLEALLIAALRYFGYNLLAVNVLFERKEYLARVYRLYQIVGNL